MRTDEKYCIIGAGAAGLAVAKTFKQRGIPFDCLEKTHDIGGLWNDATDSGIVYESTHLVSSSWTTGYDAFPMPEINYPEYPSHAVVMQYFRAYADRFEILPHIETNVLVENVAPEGDGSWSVKLGSERQSRRYKGVVVANGHHNVPRLPNFPFAGEVIHSSAYKTARQLRDRRVIVVGAGNSGCDIVRDGAYGGSTKVAISMRRGTWFVPKFLVGFPTGDVLATVEYLPLPRVIKRHLFQLSLWVLQGPPERYGLPRPQHAIDAAHPTMSDDIPRLAAHGRIEIKPNIDRFEGHDVVFSDGTRGTYDLVIFATGYKISMPFLAEGIAFTPEGRSTLFQNVAHPEHAKLFFAGLVQANGSIWRLAEMQSRLIANAIIAADHAPAEHEAFRARVRSRRPGLPSMKAVNSERHVLEANFFDYRRQLQAECRRFRTADGIRLQHEPSIRHTQAETKTPEITNKDARLPIAAE
jgi:cation diffusion facilitator CzcD-associated flavoprotein CzcO